MISGWPASRGPDLKTKELETNTGNSRRFKRNSKKFKGISCFFVTCMDFPKDFFFKRICISFEFPLNFLECSLRFFEFLTFFFGNQ